MSANKKDNREQGDAFIVIEMPASLKNLLQKTAGKKNLSLNEECYRRLLSSIDRELQQKQINPNPKTKNQPQKINWIDMIFNPERAADKKNRRKK